MQTWRWFLLDLAWQLGIFFQFILCLYVYVCAVLVSLVIRRHCVHISRVHFAIVYGLFYIIVYCTSYIDLYISRPPVLWVRMS